MLQKIINKKRLEIFNFMIVGKTIKMRNKIKINNNLKMRIKEEEEGKEKCNKMICQKYNNKMKKKNNFNKIS